MIKSSFQWLLSWLSGVQLRERVGVKKSDTAQQIDRWDASH